MEIVDKNFKIGYVSELQYTVKSVSYFFMSFFWRLVRATVFAQQD